MKGNKLGVTDLDDLRDFGKIKISVEGEKSFYYAVNMIHALNILGLLINHPFLDIELLKQPLSNVLGVVVSSAVPKGLEKETVLKAIALAAKRLLDQIIDQVDEHFKKRYEPYVKEVATCYSYQQKEMPTENAAAPIAAIKLK